MLEIDIPGFGSLKLEHLVSDYTGTLSVDGALLPGVRGRLDRISKLLKIHVLTSDTFGTARRELEGVGSTIHILEGTNVDVQKEKYVKTLGAEKVVAFGNGRNDRRMLKIARLGIAVTEGDGCASEAVRAADIHVRSAIDGLDLLLSPIKLNATLRA